MKILGGIMIAVAVFVIWYNVTIHKQNERKIIKYPLETVLTEGKNLKPCYTFTPPYTGFEIFIFGVGGLGIIFLFLGGSGKED